MNRIFKSSVLTAAIAATTLATFPMAEAGERYHRRPVAVERHNSGELLAAGVLGLAVGAIIAGANSGPSYREPVYVERYHPQPRYDGGYYRAAPVSEPRVIYADEGYGAEPWSAAWYDYCEQRYRSFDPDTGTFRGYDGRDHFCEAP